MAKSKELYFQQIVDAGIVAVIRARRVEQLLPLTEALLAGGVPGIEVTMTTPDAVRGIEMLCERFGDQAVIGAGTVIDAATAAKVIAAGAQFVVSPVFDASIVETTRKHSRISIPAGFTPTEILRAWSAICCITAAEAADEAATLASAINTGPLPSSLPTRSFRSSIAVPCF